jgi:branched-chain amino acid transport system substrate-binding protein
MKKLILLLCSLLTLHALTACKQKKEPILIGLSVNLTGKGGMAGEYIREGAMLAVEEVNNRGGVNGRPLKLVVRDDTNSTEGIRQADQELMQAGVVAIIGHTYSDSTLKAYPQVMAQGKTLLITGYTATDKLSGKDDLFFRTSVATPAYSEAAVRLLKARGLRSIVIVEDKANASFSEEIARGIKQRFDGEVAAITADSQGEIQWGAIVRSVQQHKPGAVFLLTEVATTGVAAQKLRAAGYHGDLLATLWAQTPDLIRFGGESVEGLTILTFIAQDNPRPAYRRFATTMEKRFGKAATARTDRAYELVTILAAALEKCPTPNAAELKQALLTQPFETLLSTVRFDRFGDVVRPILAVQVTNGSFRTLGEIK